MKKRPLKVKEQARNRNLLSAFSPDYAQRTELIDSRSWRKQLKDGPVDPAIVRSSDDFMKRHEVAMRRYAGWTEKQMTGEHDVSWSRAKEHYPLTQADLRANPMESFPPTIEEYWSQTPIYHAQRRPGGNIASARGFDTGGARTANAVFVSHSEYPSQLFAESLDSTVNLHTKWMYEGRVNPKKVFNHHDPVHVAELGDRLDAVLRGEVYTPEEIVKLRNQGTPEYAESIGKKFDRHGPGVTQMGFLNEMGRDTKNPLVRERAVNRFQGGIQGGRWNYMETQIAQDAIRDLGYDFFTVDGLGDQRGGTVGAVLREEGLQFERKKAIHAVEEEGVEQSTGTKKHTGWMPINKKAHAKYLEDQAYRYELQQINSDETLSSHQRRIATRDLDLKKERMLNAKRQKKANDARLKVRRRSRGLSADQRLEKKAAQKEARRIKLKKQRFKKLESFRKKRNFIKDIRAKKIDISKNLTLDEAEELLLQTEVKKHLAGKEGRLLEKSSEKISFGRFVSPDDSRDVQLQRKRRSAMDFRDPGYQTLDKDVDELLRKAEEHEQTYKALIEKNISPKTKELNTKNPVINTLNRWNLLLSGNKLEGNTHGANDAIGAANVYTWKSYPDIVQQIFETGEAKVRIEKISELKTALEHSKDIQRKMVALMDYLGRTDLPGMDGMNASTASTMIRLTGISNGVLPRALADFLHMSLNPSNRAEFNKIYQMSGKSAAYFLRLFDSVISLETPEEMVSRMISNSGMPVHTLIISDKGVEQLVGLEIPDATGASWRAEGRVVNNAEDLTKRRGLDIKSLSKKTRRLGKKAGENFTKKLSLRKIAKFLSGGLLGAALLSMPMAANAAEIGSAAAGGGSNIMPVIAAVAGTGIILAGWKAWSSRVAKSEKKVGEFAEEALGDKAPRFRIPTGRDLIGGRASLIENELELTTRGLAGSMSSVINDWGYVRRQSTTGGVIDTKWGRVWNTNGTGKYAAPGIARNGGIEGWATVRSEKELYQAWDHYIMNSEGLGSGTRRTAYRALGGKGSSVNKFLARWGGVGTMFPGAMAFYFAAKDAIHGYQKEGLIGGIKGAITGYLSAAIFNKVAGTILLNGVAGVMGAGALVGIGYAAFKIFDVRNEGNQYLQSMRSQKTSWAKGVSSFSGSVPATMRGRSLKAMEQSQFSTLKHLGSEASMLSAPRSRYATTTRVWGSRQMLSF